MTFPPPKIHDFQHRCLYRRASGQLSKLNNSPSTSLVLNIYIIILLMTKIKKFQDIGSKLTSSISEALEIFPTVAELQM